MSTQKTTSNALAIYSKVQNPIAAAKEMAKSVASMVPGTTLDQGEAIALVCMCEGIHPVEFNRRYHWIPGKGPSMRSDAMLGEFQMNRGGSYKPMGNSPSRAAMEFTRGDGEVFTRELTRIQCLLSRWPWAKREPKTGTPMGWQAANARVYEMMQAGDSEETIFRTMLPHYKDNWGTEFDWQNMLMARLLSMSFRNIDAALVAGIYTPEEMQDLEVVGATFTNNTPAPPSAAEIFKQQDEARQQAEAAAQQSQPIPQGEEAEIVMEINSDGVAVEVAPFDTDAESTNGQPATAATNGNGTVPHIETLGNGHTTQKQAARILQLREELKIVPEAWSRAMRQFGVGSALSLTQDQAQDLIAKMESGPTPAQSVRLLQLRDELGLSPEAWAASMQQRGTASELFLTKDQAQELIDKMASRLKQTAAAAGN